MKIAIIGAGAMGCLYAALLSQKNEVTVFDVVPEVVESISRSGVRVREADGSVKTYSVAAKLSGMQEAQADIVVLFVKDTVSRAALNANLSLIGKETLVLSLQNGMGNLDVIKEFVPEEQILLGTSKHNSVVEAPGAIYHSGSGITQIGSPVHHAGKAKAVCDCFSESGIESNLCEEVNHLLWQKLFINMTINPITALLDSDISLLVRSKDAASIAKKLVDEAVAVAKADGEIFDSEKILEDVLKTAKILAGGYASMCQDMKKKRKTEIDFINGEVVRLGKKYHVSTPVHEMIVELIHAKENTYEK